MNAKNDLSRRIMLAAPAMLSLAAGTTACADGAETQRGASNTLVAYFTRSGNTRVIAGTIQRMLGADLFEIRAAQPYPEDYEATVEQARRERDGGREPALASTVPEIAAYDTVFLGFPIWGETAPPVIRAFLRAHDLAGKTVRPFITHGGYGLGSSLVVLKDLAPSAKIEPPFSMEADQERRTLNQVRSWLGAAQTR
ncbi:flavodoxin [Phenylobacterium sp. Root77]|uniref:flavodoxin n=1 Tax=unclassified Phenylobacterium TaxID=2640670 RepID=UPI0006F493BC|nr:MULTISPECIES: flavodoxin [unclassified Phenylobacterium]KQW70782.1 flavodoxin [Phenylobacterium sp. Root1277]KQW90795.1 flavodoxin [Phenylobacterium sp. Root1290]KRC39572.1 flavodoxin [Phenylobacterium sp. Root77]